jgi:predicted ArsR family transcriptional regulator
METNQISPHQLRVYTFVVAADRWVTAKETAQATGVAYRTVSDHMKKLVGLGIFDRAELFPSFHYRLSAFAERRNKAYLQRLLAAKEVFSGASRAHG